MKVLSKESRSIKKVQVCIPRWPAGEMGKLTPRASEEMDASSYENPQRLPRTRAETHVWKQRELASGCLWTLQVPLQQAPEQELER